MKHTESETVGDVIYQYLREQGLETPLNEYRLIKAWNEVMGKTVSRYTTGLSIRNQVLYVRLSSASLRNEIMMRHTELVRQLNNHVGAQVISRLSIS